jgi:hypothetical protein
MARRSPWGVFLIMRCSQRPRDRGPSSFQLRENQVKLPNWFDQKENGAWKIIHFLSYCGRGRSPGIARDATNLTLCPNSTKRI